MPITDPEHQPLASLRAELAHLGEVSHAGKFPHRAQNRLYRVVHALTVQLPSIWIYGLEAASPAATRKH